MPSEKSIQYRAPALLLLIGLIVGLSAANALSAPLYLPFSVALIAACLAVGLARSKKYRTLWLCCFLLSAGSTFWAYGEIRLPPDPDPLALALPEREATLTLQVKRFYQGGERYGNLNGIAEIRAAPAESRLRTGSELYFRLKIPDDGKNPIQRGQILRATGVLSPIARNPDEADDFNAYLKEIGVHYRFERTRDVEIVRPPTPFNRFCSRMNARFQEYLRLGEPEDPALANVYVAMLLGRKVELTAAQSERFRMSGTMHFFAISGLHIGVIAAVVAQFLFLIRVPRPLSPFIGLPLLYLYVEITGASPSAVRAFLMAAFFWASYAFQRQRQPYSALIASAVFVLIFAPTNLWSIGFQLSYAVVLSILLFGLPCYEYLSQRCRLYEWLPRADWTTGQHCINWSLEKILLLFAISFSAWLASSPISAGQFGFISPGAILLNMLLVYFASLAIIGGVIAMSLGLIGADFLAGFVNHSAWMVISAMDALVRLSLKIPGAILECANYPVAMSYAGLLTYFATLYRSPADQLATSGRQLILPPLSVLVMLAIGFTLA